MRTGEFAARFGRSNGWARDLERRGILPAAPRDFAGYRVYTDEDVRRLRVILAQRGRSLKSSDATRTAD